MDYGVAEKEFRKYIRNYDLGDPAIRRKFTHSYKVVDVAVTIAHSLELSVEEIELAKIIALLHDIGRFEQHRIYGTYRDVDSIDHGNLGAEILFGDNGIIRGFVPSDEYDVTILKAIENHNKLTISDDCNAEELLHCQLIRDADKTAILRGVVDGIRNDENVAGNYATIRHQKPSRETMDAFTEHRTVDMRRIENDLDYHLKSAAFIFDYNFPKGLNVVMDAGYLDTILDTVESKENSSEIAFIKQQIAAYCQHVVG